MITSGAYKQLPKNIRAQVDKLLARGESVYKKSLKKDMPKQKIAKLSKQEQKAIKLANKGVGAYKPYIKNAASGLKAGAKNIQRSTGRFTGQGYDNFMDPYEDQVVSQAQRAVREQGARNLNQEQNRGLAAAAFGRSGRAQRGQERVMDDTSRTMAETTATLRSQGFGDAMDRASDAFGSQKDRQYQAGLGQAGIGMDYASLGGDVQRMGQGDVSFLSQVGGGLRDYTQSRYDASRANAMQDYMQPFQQVGFLADLVGGVPSGQMTYGMAPQANPYTQAGGIMGLAGGYMNR